MKKKRKKREKSPWPISLVFRLALVVSALALLISYISIYINPSLTTVPLFFGLYFVPITIINIILLIIGLFRHSGAIWITLVILLPAILFADLFLRWGKPETPIKGTPLKVCTYNVGRFVQKEGVNKDKTLDMIARFVFQEKPQVVCFQEFYIGDTAKIRREFYNYPYIYHHFFNLSNGNKFGNLTISKFPIYYGGSITFKGSTNLCIYTDIDVSGKTIRVYNTHLESHSISFTALIKKMSHSNNYSDDILDVRDRLAIAFVKRSSQVDSIAIHASNSEFPAIICGDFNDTPMSYTYHILSKNKKDSFKESGRGFSGTYSHLWPLLRIDYILYPKFFGSVSHQTKRVSYSDHYPVISEVIIP